ncbi:MAG: RNA polymerase sigma factor [Terriglobia bacterium]
MEITRIPDKVKTEAWTDEYVVERVLAGETALYEVIMRRYNQRLYRVVRAIVRDDGETEDVMQDAYVRAYQHLNQFAGRASFSTWLMRIAVHEALARVRRRSRNQQLDEPDFDGESHLNHIDASPDPEQTTSDAELRQLLEEAVLDLPEQYRIVVMMRDVEELSTSETAAALEITEENVKVRLHRGRAMMRRGLFARVGETAKETFSFMGVRCDRVVARVLQRLAESSVKDPSIM